MKTMRKRDDIGASFDQARQLQRSLDRVGSRRACELQLVLRSEEHTSELQSLMRISYAVFCLKKKKTKTQRKHTNVKKLEEKKESITKLEVTTKNQSEDIEIN